MVRWSCSRTMTGRFTKRCRGRGNLLSHALCAEDGVQTIVAAQTRGIDTIVLE
jgi:hypothetical protein